MVTGSSPSVSIFRMICGSAEGGEKNFALTQSQFSISLICFSISKPSLREKVRLHPTRNYFFPLPSLLSSYKLYLFHQRDSFIFKPPLVPTDVHWRHPLVWFTFLLVLREQMLSLNCDIHTLRYRRSVSLMTS